MLEELLQEINACENLAQDNIRKANAEAKAIIANAENKVAENNIATAEKIKITKADNIAKAEEQAKIISEKIIADSKSDAEVVLKKAKEKENSLIEDILGRIKKKYANC